MQINTDEVGALAGILADSVSSLVDRRVSEAGYDRSFAVTIYGVNRKFLTCVSSGGVKLTEGLTPAEQEDVIERFSVPETPGEGEPNCYTFALNGIYHVLRSPYSFRVGDRASVRVPGGSLSGMYLERGESGAAVELPNLFIGEDEPDDGSDAENPPKEGDYWLKLGDDESRELKAIEKYDGEDWERLCRVGAGGVGENIGRHNERFNDYSDNSATGGDYNAVSGYGNSVAGSYNAAFGCDNRLSSADSAANLICGRQNSAQSGSFSVISGRSNSCAPTASVIGGQANSGSVSYSAVCGRSNSAGGTNDSVITGYGNSGRAQYSFSGGFGNTLEASGAYAAVVCGMRNTAAQENSGNCSIVGTFLGGADNSAANAVYSAVCGSGNSVANDTQSSVLCGCGNAVDDLINSSALCGRDNTLHRVVSSVVCGEHHTSHTEYVSDCLVSGRYSDMDEAASCGGHIALLIGGGSASAARNSVYATTEGAVYAGGYYTSGADYAEYYEWLDENPENEDRRGLLVSFDGEKLIKANGDDICGAVSPAPSVIGNSDNGEWHGKYRRDIFGGLVTDAGGRAVLSEEYDSSREYIPRSKRKEWAAVGLVGRLVVRDSGKCEVNGFCEAENGIAVPGGKKTNVRVLKRLDKEHILVQIR